MTDIQKTHTNQLRAQKSEGSTMAILTYNPYNPNKDP